MFGLLLILNWSLFAICFGQNTYFDSDMIVNMTLGFASHYNTSCIRLLSGDGQRLGDQNTFEIFKRVSTRMFKTTAVYSYSQYLDISKRKLIRRTCFKPIKVIVDGSGTKEKFTDMSHNIRMADSLWLIIMNRSISEFLSDAYLPFNVELIIGQVRSRDLVDFSEAYRVDGDFPLRIDKFGKWTRSDGLDIPMNHLHERRSNLEGKVLRVGSIENWPMSSFKYNDWDGYFPRIWREVATLMNATTKPVRSKDNATGSVRGNGTWSGLIGMILEGTIDVIVAEMSINRERSKVVGYSRPVLMTKYKIYFTSPGKQIKWDAAFTPLGDDVWVALLIWIIVGTISMAVCYNFSWLYGLDAETRKLLNITESFFFVLQSLCQQGYPDTPRSTACRIVILTCFLVSSILIPSYSAAVISSLTFEKPHKPFNTLQQMLDEGTHKLLVIPNSGQYDYFRNANDPLHQTILRKLIETVPLENRVRNVAEVLEKAFCKLSNYAFFSSEKIFEMKTEYSPLRCPLVALSQDLSPVYQGFILKKGSPYRGLVNYHLQKLFDHGIIYRIEKGIRSIKTMRNEPMFMDVNVEDSFQMFFLLSCGMVLSLIILIAERLYFDHTKAQRNPETSNMTRVMNNSILSHKDQRILMVSHIGRHRTWQSYINDSHN